MLQLRCKTQSGTHRLGNDLRASSTVDDLKEAIKVVSGLKVESQRILSGYPPKPLDLSDGAVTLADLQIKSGDTFTVVSCEKRAPPPPAMKRREVPADNSCLFYSVFFALHGHLGEADYPEAKRFRADIANIVTSNPEKYTEAFLGKPPDEYGVWLQCDTSWGGGIELSILSELFQVEIAAVDVQTLRVDNYGQEGKHPTRVFLLYDGIHYDPMFLDPGNPQLPTQTIFPSSDDAVLVQALKVAESAHKARQFTDVANFTLRCLTCGKQLSGQREAQQHAKETGHGNFGEIS